MQELFYRLKRLIIVSLGASLIVLPLTAHAADMPTPQPLPQAMPAPATSMPANNTPPAASAEDVQEPDEGDMEDVPAPKKAEPAAKPPIPDKPVPEKTPAENGSTDYNMVQLRGLNKVTARAQTIDAQIGSVERMGTIEIVAHSCWKSAPEDRPEDAALLEVSEIKQGEAPKRIFLGWMFSSSPGLSSLEHPFYDITVVKCMKENAKN